MLKNSDLDQKMKLASLFVVLSALPAIANWIMLNINFLWLQNWYYPPTILAGVGYQFLWTIAFMLITIRFTSRSENKTFPRALSIFFVIFLYLLLWWGLIVGWMFTLGGFIFVVIVYFATRKNKNYKWLTLALVLVPLIINLIGAVFSTNP